MPATFLQVQSRQSKATNEIIPNHRCPGCPFCIPDLSNPSISKRWTLSELLGTLASIEPGERGGDFDFRQLVPDLIPKDYEATLFEKLAAEYHAAGDVAGYYRAVGDLLRLTHGLPRHIWIHFLDGRDAASRLFRLVRLSCDAGIRGLHLSGHSYTSYDKTNREDLKLLATLARVGGLTQNLPIKASKLAPLSPEEQAKFVQYDAFHKKYELFDFEEADGSHSPALLGCGSLNLSTPDLPSLPHMDYNLICYAEDSLAGAKKSRMLEFTSRTLAPVPLKLNFCRPLASEKRIYELEFLADRLRLVTAALESPRLWHGPGAEHSVSGRFKKFEWDHFLVSGFAIRSLGNWLQWFEFRVRGVMHGTRLVELGNSERKLWNAFVEQNAAILPEIGARFSVGPGYGTKYIAPPPPQQPTVAPRKPAFAPRKLTADDRRGSLQSVESFDSMDFVDSVESAATSANPAPVRLANLACLSFRGSFAKL
jgi:hypothetical protein